MLLKSRRDPLPHRTLRMELGTLKNSWFMFARLASSWYKSASSLFNLCALCIRCKENQLLTWHFLHGQKNHLAFLIFFTGSSVSFITGAYVAPDAVVTHCFFAHGCSSSCSFIYLKDNQKKTLEATKINEKKAISNAYLIQPPPPAQYWSKKKMISEYKGHKNMQEAGFIMNQLNLYKLKNV